MLFIWLFYYIITYHSIFSKVLVSERLKKELNNKDNDKMIDCLIQLNPIKLNKHEGMSILINKLKQHANKSQLNLMNYLNQQKLNGNLNYIKSYYISNTIAIKGTLQLLNQLIKRNDILELSTNKRFKAKIGNIPNINENQLNQQKQAEINEWNGGIHWSIKYINATNMNRQILDRASKLIYGNADTGVEFNHPALINNYYGNNNGEFNHNYAWWDANKKQFNKTTIKSDNNNDNNCGINSLIPCDDNNHGTHTMSTVIGNFGLGISPTTKWIACKNMYMNFGSPESYLGCLQFFLAPTDLNGNNPKPELRPHVIGNSYGCPPEEGCSRTTFSNAIIALKTAGIFLSISAGNEGSLGCSSISSPPAIDPNAFSVAASGYMNLDRASFSSLGPVIERKIAIDVTAPGVNITGAIRNGKYLSLQGTSMAAPHVSGAALLIMAACPHLERKVDKVEQLLRDTATPNYPKLSCGNDQTYSLPNNEYGYGIINVQKAIDLCSKEI